MHAGKSGELTPAATKGRRRLVHRLTLCVSRMNETLSRKENGAVGVGYVDLILPVRVRTCAESVGRTGGRCTGSLGNEPGRSSNGRDGEASQRYFAGRRVGLRKSANLRPVGEARDRAPRSIIRRERYGYALRRLGCVALSCLENGESFRPDEVPRRLCSIVGRASVIYKATPKGRVTRRICEAVSGSTDLWDGSRAGVASLLRPGSETQNRLK